MTIVCKDCGSVREIKPPTWYEILQQFTHFPLPSLENAMAWLEERGISDRHAEDTATAMRSTLKEKKDADGDWILLYRIGRKRTYVDVWAVFQKWVVRDAPKAQPQRNGTYAANRKTAKSYY